SEFRTAFAFAGPGPVKLRVERISQLAAERILACDLACHVVELFAEAQHEHFPSAFVSSGTCPCQRQIFQAKRAAELDEGGTRRVLARDVFEHGAKLYRRDPKLLRTAARIELVKSRLQFSLAFDFGLMGRCHALLGCY